jgi:hypothetical protein
MYIAEFSSTASAEHVLYGSKPETNKHLLFKWCILYLQYFMRQVITICQEISFAVAMLLLFHFSKNTFKSAYLLFKESS